MKKKLITKTEGFTLIETMVVMSIFLFLIIAAYDFINQSFASNLFGSEQDSAVQTARKAADVMVKEIREASESVKGDYILDTVGTSTLVFYGNVDGNVNAEKIRYFLAGRDLKRGLIIAAGSPLDYTATEQVAPLVHYINNQSLPIFTYYDTNNNLITNPIANKTDIRLIHFSLKINVTPERAPKDYYVDEDIQIRNLKDNL